MTGRHRKPSSSTGLQLSRVGALAVLATAPLVAVGTASASPSTGSVHNPERRSHDDSEHSRSSDRDSDNRESSDGDEHEDWTSSARHRARNAYSSAKRARATTTRPATASRSSRSSTSTRSTDAQWDRVAECESSGNWSANTGNGYKGGLQFSDSTWRAHGGNAYAPSADKASREEQIAIAKQVQREQGSRAWPSCGSRLGGT